MSVVLRSTAVLTGAHALGYVISFAEVAVLARALGTNAYGELLWIQATALLASIVVDYGFNLSASREIAQNQKNQKLIKSICGEVFVAKLLLLTGVSLTLVLLYVWLQPTSAAMALAGFVYLVGFGLTPFWYFQGRERMGRAVSIEITTRAVAFLVLLFLVKTPDDATLALWIMAVGSFVCTLIASTVCRYEVGHFKYSLQGSLQQIRTSSALFLYKSGSQLMTTAATTVLGAIAGKAAVGLFAPTEKIVKAVIGLGLPVFQAFYPHLSRLLILDQRASQRQSIWLIGVVTIGGLTATILLLVFGPSLMTLMLGSNYDAVNDLLFLMIWLIPLRLLNQTLGFAVLLPAQLENRASLAMLISSLISLAIGALLSIELGAQGMVLGMLLGEGILLAFQLYMVRKIF
jgi:PST family polysaccharide transporter